MNINKAISKRNFNAVIRALKEGELTDVNKEEYTNAKVKYKQSNKYWIL